MNQDELLNFGIAATDLRKKVLESAIELESARVGFIDADSIRQENLQKKLYRSKNWHHKQLVKSDPPADTDKFYTDGKTKKFSTSKLTTTDKIGLIHEVMVNKKPFADVAAQYNVKNRLISHLVCKARKEPNFLANLQAKDDNKECQQSLIAAVAQDHIKHNGSISSSGMISRVMAEKMNLIVNTD